ncbi:MAG: DMT family transporter [Nanoarchaeota archaeon]
MALNKGYSLVLMTAVISGFSIFINSYGVKEFDAAVFAFAKVALVATLLGALIIGIGQWEQLRSLSRREWLTLALIGLVGGSIPFILFFEGLRMTSGMTGAFLHKTLFLFVGLFAVLFLKERLSKGFFLGSLLILLGSAALIRPAFAFAPEHLLILGAVLLWAMENVIAKYAVQGMCGTIVAFGRMLFGSLFLLAYLAISGKAALLTTFTSTQLSWILVTGVFLLAYVLTFYNGISHIPVSTAACILSLGLPITTLLHAVFNGAAVSAVDAVGMLLIIAGVGAVVFAGSTGKLALQDGRA